MAAIIPSTRRHVDLKLADMDPEVTRSGSGDRFTVTFTMEGVDLLELQNILRPRLAGVGVERISRLGMTMSLYGVEAGREGEVFHALETAIEDVTRHRQDARDDRERSRSATEAAEAVAEGRLENVRDAFRGARKSAQAAPPRTRGAA
jgi:hypothetical protein